MENLAGNRECDPIIRRELTKAGVDIVELPAPMNSEVSASVIGLLPGFRFHRAWYYWVVQGQVPLDVARKLYEDPNGKEDVRVAGHAGCPPPEEWAEHYDENGMRLVLQEQEKSFIELYELGDSDYSKGIAQEVRKTVRFVKDPAEEAARSIITSYHIDTQEGLNFFVSTLRKHGVVPPKEEEKK